MNNIHLYLICFVVFFSGCATTGADILRYSEQSYPANPDDHPIEILDRANIDREFQVIAQVRDAVKTIYDSEDQVIANFRKAARELGGDALIDLDVSERDESHDWIPNVNTYYTALVIRYTDGIVSQ